MARLWMALPSPGMHIISLNLTAWIVKPAIAWEYAFHCCALISSIVALLPRRWDMISSCTSSDHGDGTICEHTCHSRYTITIIKAACVHGFECNDALGVCSHCSQHGACIIANSMHLRWEVISWVVRLTASQRCSVFYSSLFRLNCETLQVMHSLHAGNVSCQSKSLQAVHILTVIVHCLRSFSAYFIWPVCIAAGTVEFEYQSS